MILFGIKLDINRMTNNNIDIEKLREKISQGLHLTYKKLVRQKQAQNGMFVFSENGKIVKVKATDIVV